jgi:hypothetical protein
MKKNVSKLQLIFGTLLVIYFFSIIIVCTYLHLYESNYCSFWGDVGVDCFCEDNINCSIWYSFYNFLFDIAVIVSPILIIAVIIYNIKIRRKKKMKKV